ncbi:DUF5133 domain-containing protein [Streptomyces sp. DSM 15324]|uniref:DUF5133 domain-containing protein n=1 Tax=Streptomyces sp. DSM 15324 TaxID=1739111 RepID=UPI00099E8327|nr:DUF5133 domain-containing protein [Streptomyces sp. DSM 15324]
MLIPHPAVLRVLVEEYEALTASDGPGTRARSQDLAYTLCVSTGTRDVGVALETARAWLAAAELAAGGATTYDVTATVDVPGTVDVPAAVDGPAKLVVTVDGIGEDRRRDEGRHVYT